MYFLVIKKQNSTKIINLNEVLFISKSIESKEVRITVNRQHHTGGFIHEICETDELSVCNLDEIVKNNIIQFE